MDLRHLPELLRKVGIATDDQAAELTRLIEEADVESWGNILQGNREGCERPDAPADQAGVT